MDDDPWADAPPSKPSTPVAGSSSGTKLPTPHSPLTSTVPSAPFADDADEREGVSGQSEDDVEKANEQPFASSSSSPRALSPTSVDPPDRPTIPAEVEGDEGGFDDFDDFDEPAAGPSTGLVAEPALGGDDGFGDFGDFEEGDFDAAPDTTIDDSPLGPPVGNAIAEIPVTQAFQALRLTPLPSRPDLLDQFASLIPLLAAPSSSSSPSSQLTDEPPRTASSSRQIMHTDASRDFYVQLASPPQLKPLDWTRSRVRREHLIHMGIPVNLDEVDSHRLTPLPPLTISTNFRNMPPPPVPLSRGHRRSASLDVDADGAGLGRRGSAEGRGGKGKAREEGAANGIAATGANGVAGDKGGREGKYGIGSRPEMDQARAEELCGLEEDQLSILSPAALKALQDDLVTTSAHASALLAWLLQLKDAQLHDSATYNGMISELIANAAKAKSAQQAGSGGGVFRRGSNRRPISGSGSMTPRVASPAMR